MSDPLLAALLLLNQVLDAGNTITAFSFLLYALTFNLRERVARAFALVLACVTVVYFGDVLVSTARTAAETETWLRLQWLGISFLPTAYFHFSDALLAATGRPSRGKRRLVLRLSYLASAATFTAAALTDLLASGMALSRDVAHLTAGPLFPLFVVFFLTEAVFVGINLARAYHRCLTRTSRRRMRYLIVGSAAPAVGAFPFLMIGGGLPATLPGLFWALVALTNMGVAASLVLLAYVVAYYGVSYPDRVVKGRMLQWILRGPVVASSVLAIMIVVNRLSLRLGIVNTRAVPFVMVAVLLLLQYVITLIRPPLERWLFYGQDRRDVARLQLLEERLLTTGDLRQFLEAVLNAACDILRTRSAFVAALGPQGLELEVAVGPDDPFRGTEDLPPSLEDDRRHQFPDIGAVFCWDQYWLIPLHPRDGGEMIGILGVRARAEVPDFSADEARSLQLLVDKAAVALTDRQLQREVFGAVDRLLSEVDAIQRMRAAARTGRTEALTSPAATLPSEADLAHLVKEALSHYWGGPRLTRSPLLGLRVVQQAMEEHNGNAANALRAILRSGIERVRPEGERRFTAEWVLYNILEMKFLEGRKVRDVAMRLAMSEADLYRKQRVAIEAVARALSEMEREALVGRGAEAAVEEETSSQAM